MITDAEIKALLDGVEKFIRNRRPRVDSGYAPVKDGDITELSMILQAIIEAKWDADVDGDYPINWKFIDRTKCEPMHFRAVPYKHECKTLEEAQCVLDALLTNVNVAVHNLEIWSRVQRDVRTLQDKREADE
jgi:hypothetical protein